MFLREIQYQMTIIQKMRQSDFVNLKTFFVSSFIIHLISLYFFIFTDYLNILRYGAISSFFWGFAIIIWGTGLYLIKSPMKIISGSDESLSKSEKIILVSIVLISILLRVYKIEHLAVFIDDWYWLNDARNIQKGFLTTPFGFIGDQPSNIPSFFVYIFYALFDHTYLAARLTGIFFTVLNILLSFFLVKELFNKKAAFITAILIGTSIWDIYVSKVPWINTTINPMLMIGSMLFLYRSFKYSSLKDIFWAGLFMGISANLLYLAAVNVLALIIYSFLQLALAKDKTKVLKVIGLMAYTVILVSSPTAVKMVKFSEQTVGRHYNLYDSNVNLAKKANSVAQYYIGQLGTVIREFQSQKDNYMTHGYPYWGITIEPTIQYLFILGLLFALFNITKRQYYLMLLSFSVMFIPIVIFDQGIVHAWREYGFQSLIYIFSALGANVIISIFTKLFKDNKWAVRGILGAFFIGYFGVWVISYQDYSQKNYVKNPFFYEADCQLATEYFLEHAEHDVTMILPNEMCYNLALVRVWDDYEVKVYDSFSELNHHLSKNKKCMVIKLPITHFSSNFRKSMDDLHFDSYMGNNGFDKTIIGDSGVIIYSR